MKKLIITSILSLLIAAGTTIKAQDRTAEYLGLPGDNLNLYAVMNLFQQSETLEGFERSLNDPDSKINNLDLNGDGLVDYITIADHINGNVHTIVLQDAVSPTETQDVAIFTVQRFNNGSVQIQLIGDEALYGKNYIIEPINNDNLASNPNPGYYGDYSGTTIIATWPMIRFIYSPDYFGWHSSWYWGFYPVYWHPWRPFFWDYYYGYHQGWYPYYTSHYRHWDNYRYSHYNDYYYNRIRSHSMTVSHGIRQGNYRSTYSHPELRRSGEALYAQTHRQNSGRNYGNTRNSSINNNSRINPSSGHNSGTYQRSVNNGSTRIVSNRRSSNTMYADRVNSNRTPESRVNSSVRQSTSSGNVRNFTPSQNNRSSSVSRNDRVMTDRSMSQGSRTFNAPRQSSGSFRSSGQSRSFSSGSASHSSGGSRSSGFSRSSGGSRSSGVSHSSGGSHSGGGSRSSGGSHSGGGSHSSRR